MSKNTIKNFVLEKNLEKTKTIVKGIKIQPYIRHAEKLLWVSNAREKWKHVKNKIKKESIFPNNAAGFQLALNKT